MVGIVKKYRPKFKHGFIKGENSEDIFFTSREPIAPGTKVEYDNVTVERKGLKAGKVKILEE